MGDLLNSHPCSVGDFGEAVFVDQRFEIGFEIDFRAISGTVRCELGYLLTKSPCSGESLKMPLKSSDSSSFFSSVSIPAPSSKISLKTSDTLWSKMKSRCHWT